MAEPQNMVRMNICVPRALKARMDDVSINWSAVASAAFAAKLLALASEKQTRTMDDVIARMKAADEVDSNEQRQEGVEAGRAWARDDGRPRQLRRLVKLAENQHGIEGNLGIFDNGMNRGIGWGLYVAIEGGAHDPGWGDAEAFWESAIGGGGREKIDGFDFAVGFCEGALEVWEKVANKL